MGVHPKIGADIFPKQGNYLGQPCKVLFNYKDPSFLGRVIRDDMEDPFRTIIQLDDGRIVLGTECQYQILSAAVAEGTLSTPKE